MDPNGFLPPPSHVVTLKHCVTYDIENTVFSMVCRGHSEQKHNDRAKRNAEKHSSAQQTPAVRISQIQLSCWAVHNVPSVGDRSDSKQGVRA